MSPSGQRRHRHERGQALALMVLAMVAALTMVALIVDGGNAWTQVRIDQNGSDSAADAGATVLARRLAGEATPAGGWDAEVLAAVTSNWDANSTQTANTIHGYYTDICGTVLTSVGGRANADLSDAAEVGHGLPADNETPADCNVTGGTPGPIAGVKAVGSQTFDTFVAGIVGIKTMTSTADATAVAGFLGGCAPDAQTNCVVLPLAFPTSLVSCDNSGKAVIGSTQWVEGERYVLPICKYNGGNFGWIDWSPPNGGSSELISCMEDPSQDFCFPATSTIPVWLEAAQHGNPSNSQLEDALNAWIYNPPSQAQTVMIPLWDEVCDTQPATANDTCPGGQSLDQPTGNQNYYHLTKFAVFELEHAYTNGSNQADCNPPWSPDGASNDCIIGVFRSFITEGQVFQRGSGGGVGGAVAVQLIK